MDCKDTEQQTETAADQKQPDWLQKNVSQIGDFVYHILYCIGSRVIRGTRRTVRCSKKLGLKAFWSVKRIVCCEADHLRERFQSAFNCTWVYPARQFAQGWKECINRFRIAWKNKNYAYLTKEAFFDLCVTLKPARKMACRVMNYVLPIAGAAVLVTTFQRFDSLTYALSVEYNGQPIGYIRSESEFFAAESAVQDRIVNEDYKIPDDYIPQYTLKVVDESQLSTVEELTNEIIAVSGNEIQEAYGLYVDNNFIGATTDGDGLVLALKDMLDETREQAGEDAKVSFVQDVRVTQPMLYPVSSIVDLSNISEELTKEVAAARTYTIQPGDTPYDVANTYDIPVDTLIRNNEEVVKKFLPGDSLLIESAVPLLEKKVVRTEKQQNKLNFKTEQVQNNNYEKGFTKIKRNGETGIEEVVSEVTYIDGFEVDRTVISRNVIKEPVNAILEVGTLMPETYLNNISGGNVGGFIWPPDGGYISCPIWGYYNHTGTDIAGPAGTAIRASADGIVVFSGWQRSYGNVVIIDHGNNVRTLYAHNSALHVTAGQAVQQGQLIASMGRTGNATGNHCHFEIIINGQYKDARQYIGYSYPGR